MHTDGWPAYRRIAKLGYEHRPLVLAVYLDEFVFRHNRRRTPMAAFQLLLGLGAHQSPATYDQNRIRTRA